MGEEPTPNLNLTSQLMKKILIERACQEQGLELNNYPGYEDLVSEIVNAREDKYKAKLKESFLDLASDSSDTRENETKRR